MASDSWGMKASVIKGFENIANGAITIAPKVRYLKGFFFNFKYIICFVFKYKKTN